VVPSLLPTWSPPHAIVILYFIVYSPYFNHFIPSFEQIPTSTTLFLVLSKLTISVLSFEDLTDNSIMYHIYKLLKEQLFEWYYCNVEHKLGNTYVKIVTQLFRNC
jgi:hypothetical protein